MAEDTELNAFLEDSAADATEAEDIANELEQDPESMGPQTFTVRGHVCEIRFSRKRIDLYEERHTPIIASFYKNDGMFTFKELAAIAGYGLKVQGGGYFLPQKAEEIVNKLIDTNGYPVVFQAVMMALQRDCAFYSRAQGTSPNAPHRLRLLHRQAEKRRSRARRRPVPQGGRLRVLRRQAWLGLRAVRAAHARAARVRAQRA